MLLSFQVLPSLVHSIQVSGDRVYVGDLTESILFLKYKRAENALVVFADDYSSRYITATAFVDHSTIAGADKFGNVFLLRLPADVRPCRDDLGCVFLCSVACVLWVPDG